MSQNAHKVCAITIAVTVLEKKGFSELGNWII